MGGNPYYPPMPNPFFSFPYFPPPQAFPPLPYQYPEPSTTRVFQEFLLVSANEATISKTAIRNILRKMVTYIDENYLSIRDPRIKEDILLSYCDIYSPKFIGPLLDQYILQKTTLEILEQTGQSEVGILKRLMSFLKTRIHLMSSH